MTIIRQMTAVLIETGTSGDHDDSWLALRFAGFQVSDIVMGIDDARQAAARDQHHHDGQADQDRRFVMRYATGNMCARCRIRVDQIRDCLGESGIYSPDRAFTLCEPCFEDEDRELDGPRGNNLPERIEMYRVNLRAGPLNFRAPVPPLEDKPQ